MTALSLFDETPAPRGLAVLSPCGRYRYRLDRTWGTGPTAVWVMLNPSTADAEVDDPTIRKVIGFSRRLGCAGATVFNLYAYRATDPRDLHDAMAAGIDVVGPDNDRHIAEASSTAAQLLVAAWGANEPVGSRRVAAVARLLARDGGAVCLGRCKGGQPRHPLMVAYTTTVEPWAAA